MSGEQDPWVPDPLLPPPDPKIMAMDGVGADDDDGSIVWVPNPRVPPPDPTIAAMAGLAADDDDDPIVPLPAPPV
jgi:hypothetical protein